MGQDLPDRDFLSVGNLREELVERIRQLQFSLLDKLQHHHVFVIEAIAKRLAAVNGFFSAPLIWP